MSQQSYEPQPQSYQQMPPQPPQAPPGQLQPWQPPYPQYAPVQVAPKSVLGAVVVSFFIPGSGAIYAGEKIWGIVILALWLVSIPLTLVVLGWVTLTICWVVGMISGGMAAQRWNREHGIIS